MTGRSRNSRTTIAAVALVFSLLVALPAAAELTAEKTGTVLTLPAKPGVHWFWVGDFVLMRSALFDADTTRMLGMVDGGQGVSGVYPRYAAERGEIYVPEAVYSRGRRGKRIDLVTIYDAKTLSVIGDVEIPPKMADAAHGVGLAALLDDGRFFAVFNLTPASSVSIVDLETRSFVGEIDTAGCALVYAAGPRRFVMLCGDGKARLVTLDEAGHETSRVDSIAFFDPATDPVTEKGVRGGDSWYFASFDGQLHQLDVSGDKPRAEPPWSLFTDADRRADWRIGGAQHLALHRATGRLYSIVHKGGPGSHKDPGTEIWVYDLEKKARVQRIEVRNLLVPFIGAQITLGADSAEAEWSGSFMARLLGWLLPNEGAHAVAVTQDDAPVLIVGNIEYGAVAIYDAMTGKHLRDIGGTGITGGRIVVP